MGHISYVYQSSATLNDTYVDYFPNLEDICENLTKLWVWDIKIIF